MCFGITGSEARVARRRRLVGGISRDRLDAMAEEMIGTRRRMHADRSRRIDELVAKARAAGGIEDRFHWTLVYDLEMAPVTTGRALLLEHRIVPVPPQDLESADALHDELWTVIEALAASGVFLLNTDHLDDRDLYGRLYFRILDEPTRALPPESEASEFIDCLHPLDIESGGLGRRLADRIAAGEHEPPSTRAAGVRGPAFRRAPAERDRWLPRPTG
jgi:hypothetical protein